MINISKKFYEQKNIILLYFYNIYEIGFNLYGYFYNSRDRH